MKGSENIRNVSVAFGNFRKSFFPKSFFALFESFQNFWELLQTSIVSESFEHFPKIVGQSSEDLGKRLEISEKSVSSVRKFLKFHRGT